MRKYFNILDLNIKEGKYHPGIKIAFDGQEEALKE